MNALLEEKKYLLNIYKRIPVQIIKGEGVYLIDDSGKKYLDLLSGIAVNALGYNHPLITKALLQQQSNNLHLSNFFVQEIQVELAKKLIELTSFSKVFFSNSGTEAIEGLLKLAKKWGNLNGKKTIISFRGSFHGRSLGAVSITGQEKYYKNFEPVLPNVQICPFNDAEAFRKMVNNETCVVFFEGIAGEGGIREISGNMIDTMAELRKEYGFLVIADEIQTGIGRTGKFFNYEHLKLVPDAIATAKGLGGGLPLGSFLVSEKLADIFDVGEHGTTFGGNPLACATGLATVKVVSEPSFLNDVTEKGEYFKTLLLQLKEKHSTIIKDVRGRGLMLGLEVKHSGKELMEMAISKGLILNVTAATTVLRFVPPLIIEKEHMDYAVNILDEIFGSLI